MKDLRIGARWAAWLLALAVWASAGLQAQTADAALIKRIDDAVRTRYEHVLAFSDMEHYAVYRGDERSHPAAEMTVKVTYRKGQGKSYTILSQSGSRLIQKFGLRPLLENEKKINDPASVEQSWFTSANYNMHPKAGQAAILDGRTCAEVAIAPRRKAPNMVLGTLWVDVRDGSIVRVEGIASQSPSIFAGTTKMMRQYAQVKGYAMAMHARAESGGVFGHTVVVIDYSDYQLLTR